MADVLLVIAEKNFQDMELACTKSALEKAGLAIVIASKTPGVKQGALGGTANAELSLAEVNVCNYKAIIFIGGGGSQKYFNDREALKIASDASSANKIIAAICIAPVILANAGILEGKKATVWNDYKKTYSKKLEIKGAIYTGSDVEKDDNIITANGPESASKFGSVIANAIKKH